MFILFIFYLKTFLGGFGLITGLPITINGSESNSIFKKIHILFKLLLFSDCNTEICKIGHYFCDYQYLGRELFRQNALNIGNCGKCPIG